MLTKRTFFSFYLYICIILYLDYEYNHNAITYVWKKWSIQNYTKKTQLIIDVCFFRRWEELKQKNVSCSRVIMFGLFDGYITNVYHTSLFRLPWLTLFDYIFHAHPFFKSTFGEVHRQYDPCGFLLPLESIALFQTWKKNAVVT